MGGFAWVTLATNDSYSLGALVLAHSLRRAGTKHDLAILITPGVTQVMREKLASVYSLVQEVNVLDSKDEANLALLARPELGITFTKLHCWRLTQYEKCVFVDADALVVRNCDELFEREELTAAPDVGWPDCFNSGVFVFKPSQQTFASITSFAAEKGSFDGGDQGLLNSYFSDWAHKDISKHLPFIYNMCSTATYSYLPAYKQFGENVRIIHFIGATKPWLQYFDTETSTVHPPSGCNHLQPLLQLWWNIFCENVYPKLSPVMAGIAGALAKMTLGEPRSAEQVALEEHMRRQGWEQGQIDYMGRDSFDNIWKKILSTISQPQEHQPSPTMETQNVEISSPVVPSSPLAATSSSIAVCTTPDVSSPSIPSGESVATLHSNDVIEFLKSEPIVEPLTVRDEPKLPEEPKSVEPDLEAKSVVVKSPPEEKIPTEFAAEELKVTTQAVQSSPVSTKVPLPESTETEPLTKKTVEALQTSPALPKVEPPENIEPVLSKPETATSEILIQPSSIFSEGQSPAEKIMAGQVSSSAASEVEPFANIEPVPPSDPETATSESPKPSPISLHAKEETDPVSETKLEEFVSTFEVPKSVVKESSAVLEAETTESKAKPSAALAVSGTSLISGTELGTESATSELTELILDSSSVPIQVAESVLQSEPKESVSEDQRPVTEEAISSVVAPVLETATAVSETVAEAKAAEESKAAGNSFRNGVGSAITPLEIPAQIPEPEIPADIPEPEIPAPVKIEPVAVAPQEAEISGEESSKSASLTPPDSPGTTVPVRPIRTKDSRIPTTPIVTEATPPNSPPIGGVESLEDQPLKSVKKVVKKVVKKAPADVEGAEGAADSETVGKKVVKKVVKKIVKKPKEETDDGAETSSAATEKPKKTVKVVKKVVKPSESLEVDASIPDTPPVGEVPVPPRRKTKTTTTTTTKTTTTSGKSPAAEEAAKPSESKS
ncbi:neurofilament heavy polypeptide isoform X2 [Neodiprion virginianus]|uniref:neurofilament heavy polypeptide isoform X2 n=1 Tax=Neodiprion virginianus TaxID=2961670 RepID=UPI001EE768C3|nr:neurofilament heavy polypeptide isoform X2 [Neodiprion virginianus]